jgi:plastocyanin
MRGTVFVRASSLRDSAYVQVGFGGATVYSPDTVTIKPNGTVRWKNVSTDVQHTATSN